MNLPKNPFNPGVPASPAEFVGRESLIHRLEASIFNTHHQALVSLVGQRRIGKTSLLKKVQYEWKRSGLAICVMLDCQEFASLPSTAWLCQILAVLGVEVKPKHEEDRSYLWKAIGSCLRELEGRVVLVLDEFEAFAGPAAADFDGTFFGRLRSLLISEDAADRLTMIVSTRRSLANYDWAEDVVGSPFINIVGYFLAMDLMSRSESHDLLSRGSAFLSDSERDLILRLAGPHPHFLQGGGSEAWHIKREELEVSNSPGYYAENDDFELTLRRRFQEQSELVFRQMLDDVSGEESEDLCMRSVLGVGDHRLEQGLRRRLLLDGDGGLLSEGLQAFFVADSSLVRRAIRARFDTLPQSAQVALIKAANTGEAVEGLAGEVLRRAGWLGADGQIRDRARAWVPLSTEE